MSLRFKILTAVVLVMVSVLALLVFNLTLEVRKQSAEYQKSRQAWAIRVIENTLRDTNMVQNPDDMTYSLKQLEQAGLVAGYSLVGRDGAVFESQGQVNPSPELVARAIESQESAHAGNHVVMPVFIEGQDLWGTVQIRIKLPPQLTYTGPELFENVFWMMCFGTLVLLAVLYIVLAWWVLRPIERMAKAADYLATGKYEFEIPFSDRPDEIGQLLRAFRSMRHQLANYHNQMKTEIEAARVTIQKQERGLMVAQRLAATGTLAAGIAHEVNNPIGGMLNAALRLKKQHADDEKTVQYLDMIIEALNRVKETVSKVLQFTPREVKVGPVKLDSVVHNAVGLARHRMKRRGVELTCDVPDGLPDIQGNQNELQQVILNMIFNAIDAIEDETGTITIRAEPNETAMRIEITDSGCGMSDEEMSQAFDLFWTTKEPGKGTGLGLSIAHNIISGHAGQLELDSPGKGQGTTVRITLPLSSEFAQ